MSRKRKGTFEYELTDEAKQEQLALLIKSAGAEFAKSREQKRAKCAEILAKLKQIEAELEEISRVSYEQDLNRKPLLRCDKRFESITQ